MLNEELIEKVVARLTRRIDQANEYILQEIGKSIKRLGTLTPSKAQELAQIMKYGGDYDKIVKKLAQITDLNEKDIYKIFKEVARNDYKFAEQFYKYKDIKYIPFDQNEALQRQIRALADITANEYKNISKTMAFASVKNGKIIYTPLAKMYQNLIDEAILNVGQGKETFNSAMRRSLKQLGKSGIRTVDYVSGRSIRMDSAIRMNVKSGLTKMHDAMQRQLGEEFDADGVEISVHEFPAPDHEYAQGNQFTNEEYDKLQTYGYATAYNGEEVNLHLYRQTSYSMGLSFRPIGEYNCYHYIFAIVLGVSQPTYTKDELEKMRKRNQDGFNMYGKHYTMYEGTQLQRQLETKIKDQKHIYMVAKASGDDDLMRESEYNINDLNAEYKHLSDVSGLQQYKERLAVSGYKK